MTLCCFCNLTYFVGIKTVKKCPCFSHCYFLVCCSLTNRSSKAIGPSSSFLLVWCSNINKCSSFPATQALIHGNQCNFLQGNTNNLSCLWSNYPNKDKISLKFFTFLIKSLTYWRWLCLKCIVEWKCPYSVIILREFVT